VGYGMRADDDEPAGMRGPLNNTPGEPLPSFKDLPYLNGIPLVVVPESSLPYGVDAVMVHAPDYSQDTPSQVQAYASLMATAAAEAVKARYGERGARAVRDALRGKGDSLAKELEVMEMFRRKVVLALMACLEGLPKLEQFAAREAEAREHLRRMARERGL
jgi:hypothetical protein